MGEPGMSKLIQQWDSDLPWEKMPIEAALVANPVPEQICG